MGIDREYMDTDWQNKWQPYTWDRQQRHLLSKFSRVQIEFGCM